MHSQPFSTLLERQITLVSEILSILLFQFICNRNGIKRIEKCLFCLFLYIFSSNVEQLTDIQYMQAERNFVKDIESGIW